MAANSYYETKFRSWILEKVSQSGFLVKKIANSRSRIWLQHNHSKKIFRKINLTPGPLYEYKDETGTNFSL